MTEMTTTALAGWYGSNRDFAHAAGAALGRLAWCGVPFAGGCCELPHIKTRAGLAADLHRHIVNMARVVAGAETKEAMAREVASKLYHPDELAAAQRRCREREEAVGAGATMFGLAADSRPSDEPDVQWAIDYFVCCWMGRGALAGTPGEFSGGLSFRWTSSGGASSTRYRSAVASLEAWHRALLPWEFVTLDAFDFLAKCKDQEGHGVYCDPPWVGAGDGYTYRFTEAQHRRLAVRLSEFRQTRVVVRYGADPLIEALYPESAWTWHRRTTRSQANGEVPEVLIVSLPGAEGRGEG